MKYCMIGILFVVSLHGADQERSSVLSDLAYWSKISNIVRTGRNKNGKISDHEEKMLKAYGNFGGLDKKAKNALLGDLKKNKSNATFAPRNPCAEKFAVAAYQLRTEFIEKKMGLYSVDERQGFVKEVCVALSTEDALQKEVVRRVKEKYDALLMQEASRLAKDTLRYVALYEKRTLS